MSMISAQIDELRKEAEYYDGSEVASIMRDAADTIWQLRDDLQRANAENAELRERIHELEMEGSDHFYRTAYAEDANRTLEAENARLRERVDAAHMSRLLTENENEKLLELLQRTWDAFHDATACEFVTVKNELREFGVEVD